MAKQAVSKKSNKDARRICNAAADTLQTILNEWASRHYTDFAVEREHHHEVLGLVQMATLDLRYAECDGRLSPPSASHHARLAYSERDGGVHAMLGWMAPLGAVRDIAECVGRHSFDTTEAAVTALFLLIGEDAAHDLSFPDEMEAKRYMPRDAA